MYTLDILVPIEMTMDIGIFYANISGDYPFSTVVLIT